MKGRCGSVLLCGLALMLAAAPNRAGPPTAPPYLTKEELAVRKRTAGDDPFQLLALTGLVSPTDAQRLRLEIGQLLREQTAHANGPKSLQLAKRISEVLPRTVHNPVEITELLGTPKLVAREILYRRYLEQRVYDQPLPLAVVFEFPKGEDPRLFSVLPVRPEKP